MAERASPAGVARAAGGVLPRGAGRCRAARARGVAVAAAKRAAAVLCGEETRRAVGAVAVVVAVPRQLGEDGRKQEEEKKDVREEHREGARGAAETQSLLVPLLRSVSHCSD